MGGGESRNIRGAVGEVVKECNEQGRKEVMGKCGRWTA